jgi:hypothetical protein
MYANWMNPISQTGSSWIFADASLTAYIGSKWFIGQEKT